MLEALLTNLRRRCGGIMLRTRARALRMKHARCIGITAERGGRSLAIEAATVLLADGGFQANPAL
jgi:FAD binding domain-containing protein